MKYLTYVVCAVTFISCLPLFGQNEIVIGKMDSLQSEILNENRKLMVYVPKGGSDSTRYPVIYLLDGDGHFASVVGTIEHLSNSSLIPPMMVVAIPNTNRNRDLTPSKSEPNPPMVPKELSEQSGGGKNFLSFMENELFPYIEKNYPTASYRTFIGHSFGGLLVMDALQDKPYLFQSYIAIDPSMWWDNKLLLKSYKASNLNDGKYKNRSLYMGIANTLEDGMDTISVKKAKGPMVAHFNSIFETRDMLRKVKNDKFYFKSKYYENDNHGSVPLITTYDGLRYIFEFYKFEIKFSDVMKPNTDVVNRMKAHYDYITKTLGYENKPEEYMINGMGYQLMQMDKIDLAGQFFKMNVAYYPKSANVYDSLGDYYLAADNKEQARLNFEKALRIEENPGSRKKLEQLKQD